MAQFKSDGVLHALRLMCYIQTSSAKEHWKESGKSINTPILVKHVGRLCSNLLFVHSRPFPGRLSPVTAHYDRRPSAVSRAAGFKFRTRGVDQPNAAGDGDVIIILFSRRLFFKSFHFNLIFLWNRLKEYWACQFFLKLLFDLASNVWFVYYWAFGFSVVNMCCTSLHPTENSQRKNPYQWLRNFVIGGTSTELFNAAEDYIDVSQQPIRDEPPEENKKPSNVMCF